MNESEFLELLNLYLDHEITAADSARLEAEVQSNAARRAIYRDYCRMQKACRILAADLQVEESGVRNAAGGGKILAFESRPAWHMHRVGLYLAGSAAVAAACAVIILGRQPGPSSEGAGSLTSPALAVASTMGTTQKANIHAVPVANSSQRGLVAITRLQDCPPALKVSLVADSLVLSGGRQAEAVLLAAGQDAEDQLAWMRNFQLVSMQERKKLEEFRFESTSPSLRPEARQLGGHTPADAVEMAAFRFIK